MNYIVLDLEWNQGNANEERSVCNMPFEIVEIGAVKLNSNREITDQFERLVKPQVYHTMHYVTRKLIQLDIKELLNEKTFPQAVDDFLRWCGDDYIFCTWGPLDLSELQRNMKYYGLGTLSDGPFEFLDVQKLFSIAFEDKKSRRTLEYAVDMLHIAKDIPFHRAYADACYTGEILERIDKPVMSNYSFDVYVPPKDRKSEIFVQFDNYSKYISREFADKQEALDDKEVKSIQCYLCRKNIRRKLKWFTPNGKHYYAVGFCSIHGYMKAKVRIKKSHDENVYVVKTTKFISEEEVSSLRERKEKAKKQNRIAGLLKSKTP